MEIFRLLFRKVPFLFILLVLSPHQVFALDESRLWLPTSYEKLYLELRAAARAAEALDRCKNVLRGTIDLEQSRKDHPIFRIQCRQENNRTYNEMVDGLTQETLTTKIELPVGPSPEEIEGKKRAFYEQCFVEFSEKTDLFQKLIMADNNSDPVEFTMERAKFYLDFKAENPEGDELSYRSICLVSDDSPLELHIRKRRE